MWLAAFVKLILKPKCLALVINGIFTERFITANMPNSNLVKTKWWFDTCFASDNKVSNISCKNTPYFHARKHYNTIAENLLQALEKS
ncbi:MAG: hypothetical protein EAY72_11265 [Bacteroidetes bacterium]|nr:MAG: hypothetical protein EAY72_11265 [Bacteroidota bacterium]TAE70048.1 MAG: hypothetical protein EAY68_03155 [Bacteroidota bacterium]